MLSKLLNDNNVRTARITSSIESENCKPKQNVKIAHFKTKCCSLRHSNTNPYWYYCSQTSVEGHMFYSRDSKKWSRDDQLNDHVTSKSASEHQSHSSLCLTSWNKSCFQNMYSPWVTNKNGQTLHPFWFKCIMLKM